MSETAALADVVLPAAAFPEKEGTFTNTERRVQLLNKAVEPPGEARAGLGDRLRHLHRHGLPDVLSERRRHHGGDCRAGAAVRGHPP